VKFQTTKEQTVKESMQIHSDITGPYNHNIKFGNRGPGAFFLVLPWSIS